MAKNNTGNGKLKEALGILAVIAGTGLILLLVYLLSHCDFERKPDPHKGNLESGYTLVDSESGIKYVRCPQGIGANVIKDEYLTVGSGDIKLYTIVFEDPKEFISEAKDALGGSFVYRAESTEEIKLESYAPISAGIYKNDMEIDNFYVDSVAEEYSVTDGTMLTKCIQDALLTDEDVKDTGEYTDKNDFYIRLYSKKYPGLYYEVMFFTNTDGVAYLLDMVTGKTVLCPDIITAEMIG